MQENKINSIEDKQVLSVGLFLHFCLATVITPYFIVMQGQTIGNLGKLLKFAWSYQNRRAMDQIEA